MTALQRPAAALLAAALALLAGACGDRPERDSHVARAGSGPSPVLAVTDLVTAVSPCDPGATPQERDAWFARRKATLERLRTAGAAVGNEAWRRYREERGAPVEVRIGLLDVASHNVPEETREHLVELVGVFGEDLALRRAACDLLADTSPEAAVATIEPVFEQRTRQQTYPPEDLMLAALLRAKRALGQDPTDLLAHVATDLRQAEGARHLALRELAGTHEPRGLVALEQILVESGTNSYLRRLAGQALLESLPREEFCAKVNAVLEREADLSFQIFLVDLIERNCR